ncbi:hypothetical protein [Rahnella aceris]|uniref:Uncharacterized protein n=1 Tax=Rahnella sp. (strain Y9602) TaxID=2703885 RepID=A0ABW6C772_RAHSY
MKRYEKILVGDKDKRDEIFDVCLSIGITKEILDRCSLIFIMQIYGTYMSRAENPYKIGDEILHLEGLSRRGQSSTKPATMFNRKAYLKGLWHKHYLGSSVSDMAINLMGALHNYGLPKLEADVNEVMSSGEERYFTPEDAGRIAHEAAVENFLRRSQEQRLTGHWIIYAVHEGQNFYLSLGRHNSDEAEIRRNIDTVAVLEFPFLSEILHPID